MATSLLSNDLVLRCLSALVGIPVLLAAVWWGAPWVFLLVALAAILGIRELYRLHPNDSAALPVFLGALWVLAFVIAGQSTGTPTNFLLASAGVFLVGVFVAVLWTIAYYDGRGLPIAAAYLLGGPLYIGFLLAHAVALRELGDGGTQGRDWLLLALAVTFATDVGAFFTGRSVGRHRMAPTISPGKTWEGVAGGLVSSIAASLVVGQVLSLEPPAWQVALLGLAASVAAQMGDLWESRLKRISQVKDAGSIIPGHGGVLDRLDSLLWSVPTVYYLVVGVLER